MRTGIFPLKNQDRPALARHLLRLNGEDRRLRFFYAATDEQIETFVRLMPIEKSQGFFVDDVLVATASVTPEGPGRVEFAVSVNAEQRGHGLAGQLLAYGIERVEATDVQQLSIHYLAENVAMAAVHRTLPHRRERTGTEVDVVIDLNSHREEREIAMSCLCPTSL